MGVYAQAIGQANLRADDNIEARLVGEIRSGVSYPVLGRSQLYPWLLLGESDNSDRPLGWVFETLVVVSGDINRVPFTDLIIDALAAPIRCRDRAVTGSPRPQQPSPRPRQRPQLASLASAASSRAR